MNIFFLALCATECAQMHGDKHVIKMILETAQMLSTIYRFVNGERPNIKTDKLRKLMEEKHPVVHKDDTWIVKCEESCGMKPYRMTHYKHGSVLWARQNVENYIWLTQLGLALCEEKLKRYPNNPPHKSQPLIEWFANNPPSSNYFDAPSSSFTPPYLAMPDNLKSENEECTIENHIELYRKYYRSKQEEGIVFYKRIPERKPQWLN